MHLAVGLSDEAKLDLFRTLPHLSLSITILHWQSFHLRIQAELLPFHKWIYRLKQINLLGIVPQSMANCTRLQSILFSGKKLSRSNPSKFRELDEAVLHTQYHITGLLL